jgi:hypothetical protein
MEGYTDSEVIATAASLGKQISRVFHVFWQSNRVERGTQTFLLLIDVTVAALESLRPFVADTTDGAQDNQRLLNDAGYRYIRNVAEECVVVFLLLESSFLDSEGILKRKSFSRIWEDIDLRVELGERAKPVSFDEKAMLRFLESDTKVLDFHGSLARATTERLRDLKVHMHLIYQVISVRALGNTA